jgi:acetyl esterase/lipase
MWNHTCPPDFSDHTYATKQGVDLDLRIWPASTNSTSESSTHTSTASASLIVDPSAIASGSGSPWILYVHGGAFCGGKHYLPNAWVIPSFRPRGYTIVSIAYRFAPFAGLDEMREDGQDAFEWCRLNLPQIVPGVDIDNCVLIGESAGGTIVSLLAHYLKPIKAVVNIYGPTDFLDPHYSPKTPANSTDIQPLDDKWSEEDCRHAIQNRDLEKAITVCPYVFDIPINQVRTQWAAPTFNYTEEQRFNWQVKRYMRTHKLLFKVILRTDQIDNEEEELEIFKKSSPLHMLRGEYPPTWFLHGESDSVVPLAQAVRMRDKLNEMGVETGISFEPGQGHEFDNKYTVC